MTYPITVQDYTDDFFEMAYREIKRYGQDGFLHCAMDIVYDHQNDLPRINELIGALDVTGWSAGLKYRKRQEMLELVADGIEIDHGRENRPAWHATPDNPVVSLTR